MAEPFDMSLSFPEPDERFRPGVIVGGKYRLDRQLGEGGMGVVWCATHIELDAPVAIKVLHPRDSESPDVVESFLREAKAAAGVRHRNVVTTTDFGADPDGQPYMVMEMLEGTNLASRLLRPPPLTVVELVDLMAQCLSGLAAVHDSGIVLGDLKRDNVFLVKDADGVYPKLIDFGISRALRDSDTPTRITPSGVRRRGAMATIDDVMMGTPSYMSPEQALGLADVDRRADLYAVGVILYEGLVGEPPYDAPNVRDLLGAIVQGGAPPVSQLRPDVGSALCAVIEKAMAPRQNRYSDARELRAALLAAMPLTPNAELHQLSLPPEVFTQPTLSRDELPIPLSRRKTPRKSRVRNALGAFGLIAALACVGAGIAADDWRPIIANLRSVRATPASIVQHVAPRTAPAPARRIATLDRDDTSQLGLNARVDTNTVATTRLTPTLVGTVADPLAAASLTPSPEPEARAPAQAPPAAEVQPPAEVRTRAISRRRVWRRSPDRARETREARPVDGVFRDPGF